MNHIIRKTNCDIHYIHIFVAYIVYQDGVSAYLNINHKESTSHFHCRINSARLCLSKQRLQVVIFAYVVAVFANFPGKSFPTKTLCQVD